LELAVRRHHRDVASTVIETEAALTARPACVGSALAIPPNVLITRTTNLDGVTSVLSMENLLFASPFASAAMRYNARFRPLVAAPIRFAATLG